MKKILTIVLVAAMAATLAVTSFASTTTWEDDRAVGLSVNNREADGTGSDGFNAFRSEFTNTHNSDPDRTTNFIIAEDNGNRCVKLDASEGWMSDWNLQGENNAYYSVDIKPTKLGTFTGIYLYCNPYSYEDGGNPVDGLILSTNDYLGGTGMVIKDANTVTVYAIMGETITYDFNTGLDLTADWHTYTAYDSIDDCKITYCIDNKVVAVLSYDNGALYDNEGNLVAEVTGSLYEDDPRAGFAFICGDTIDMLIDNLSVEGFETAPTEKFVASADDDTDTDVDVEVDVDADTDIYPDTNAEEETVVEPAPATADLAVAAIVALGAFAVAKKH